MTKRGDDGDCVQPCASRIEEKGPAAIRSVSYWNEYAPWYRLWLDHTDYHHGIKDLLAGIVRPGWRVLDIGGGSGVLAIPLMRSGCRVTVVEPSEVMRAYLRTEMVRADVEEDRIIALPWEEVPVKEILGFDLALASNSLHLTRIGAFPSLMRILAARPAEVLVVSELEIPFDPDGNGAAPYGIGGAGSFQAESSFRYHSVEEALRHLDLKERHGQSHPSRPDFIKSLMFENGHYIHKRWTTVHWFRLTLAAA
ncbi:MAG: methyltransferase domain-containing protein [Acidobacteriota bacterium]|nr:methyltransferase domain-containing protein [Acidobacteriota bacterium]